MWLVSQHTDGEVAKNDCDDSKLAGAGSGGGGSGGGGLGVVGGSGGGVLSEGLEDNSEGLSPVSFPLMCVMWGVWCFLVSCSKLLHRGAERDAQ